MRANQHGMTIDTKKCTKCGEEKAFTEYSPHAHGKFGLQARCKACCTAANTARYHANLEASREKARLRAEQYRAEHPEEDRARKKAWAAAHKEQEDASKRAWALRNPEKVAAAKEAWRLANKDRWNATGKAWKKKNPAAMHAIHLRKYGLTPESFDALVLSQSGRCAICGSAFTGGKNMHIDHHHDSNRVRGLLCTSCNTALGGFKESHKNLLAAVDYLVEHGDVPGMLP